MMKYRQFIYLFVVSVIISACTRRVQQVTDEERTKYTEQAAMSQYLSNPERALLMLDSAVVVGNMEQNQCDYLKAIVYYSGMNIYSNARDLLFGILQHESTAEDTDLQCDVYTLLAMMSHSVGDDAGVMRYAPRAIELANRTGEVSNRAKVTAYLAHTMANSGATDEAIEMLNNALTDLNALHTYRSAVSYQSTAKVLVKIYQAQRQYDKMLSQAEDMLTVINHFAEHTSEYKDIPDGFSPQEFIDFSRSHIYCYLCIAHANLGNREEAHRCETLCRSLTWGKDGAADMLLCYAYLPLHEFDKFDANLGPDRVEGDSIVKGYYDVLMLRYEAAQARQRTAQAIGYLSRATAIKDSIYTQRMQQQIAEQNALYHLNEQTLARERAEARATFVQIMLATIIVGLIVALLFAVYFFLTRRHIKHKNKVLVRMIDELQETERAQATEEQTTNQKSYSEAVYQQLVQTTITQHLYSDIQLDRDKFAEIVGLSRNDLNKILNMYADGQSFPNWINRFRLTEACRLLRTESDMSINDIAAQVGLTANNLRRLFSAHYGISPTEYRQNRE